MPSQESEPPLGVRALRKCAGTPFTVAGYPRNTHLEADLTDQILHLREQRLVRTLLMLAGCRERRHGRYVLPDISQEIIAEIVGTTRSRVNVFMGKFKKLGFIEDVGDALQVKPSLLHVVHHGNRGVSNGTSQAAIRH
jgi:Crp-like helix-turn-helix protein